MEKARAGAGADGARRNIVGLVSVLIAGWGAALATARRRYYNGDIGLG